MKHIKVGDTVKIISGSDRGKQGKVKAILRKKKKAVIENINTRIKHIKAQQANEGGKIIKFDAPIDLSNVMLCDSNGLASRIMINYDENKKKTRISKKSRLVI